MIAINNTAAFAELEFDSPPVSNVDLTADKINEHLTGSAIINSSITTAVKTMLLSIIENLNIDANIKSKIASFAGFSVNTTVTPNVVIFNSTKVSLDKLTFYIIFRLPYTKKGLTYEDIGDGLTSSSLTSNPTSWGKYANYIRSLSGSGIKKINSAGEQVDSNGKAIDDNGNVIEGWYSEKAYSYLGQNPFNGTYTIPPGCYQASTERAMLFGQNTDQPNGTNPSLEITKIPLYFYLLAKVENPYGNAYWLKSNKDSLTISRIPHWPATIGTKKYRRHFVKRTSSSPSIAIPNATYSLNNDANGTYFFVAQPAPSPKAKIYIEAISNDTFTYEGLNVNSANKVEKNDNGLIAIWEDKYSNPSLSNNSGLTIGMGVDMGATFNGFYTIKFNITFSGSGSFRLYSGDRRSSLINTTGLTCSSLKATIVSLTDTQSDKVTVRDSENKTIGVPNKISIVRQYGSNNQAYNHKIYAYDISSGLSITMTESQEENRWEENSSVVNDGWFYFNKLLNFSFSNNPTTDQYWLDQLSLSNTEKTKLLGLLKKVFGCRSKASYHIWHENKSLFKKLELKSYTMNLRATYHKFFVPRFYDKQRTLANGSLAFNGTSGKDTVAYLLDHPNLKTKPNQAELFAIVLLNYNYPAAYRAKLNALIDAINEHSIPKLKATLAKMSQDRKDALNNFISANVKSKLYHGIED